MVFTQYSTYSINVLQKSENLSSLNLVKTNYIEKVSEN